MSENACVADPGVSEVAEGAGVRRLSELRVIDLRAELKKRNLDISGNKSLLSERLKKVTLLQHEGLKRLQLGLFCDLVLRQCFQRDLNEEAVI